MNTPPIHEDNQRRRPVVVEYDSSHQVRFAALVKGVHEEFGFRYDPVLDRDLKQPEVFYRDLWVLLHGGQVVGSVALKEKSASRVELKRLYLAASFRGQGYGKALLDLAIAEARRAGYIKMVLDTSHRQEAARRAYEAAGFQRTGERNGDLLYELALSDKGQ